MLVLYVSNPLMGFWLILHPYAFATGEWEPEQEVVDAIKEQAAELLQALD